VSYADRAMSPQMPSGRFKRLWMEFEVEVVDDMALQSFALSPITDAHGEVTGVADMSANQRVGFALRTIAAEAWREAEEVTGIRWLGGSGPSVRLLDETGAYAEMTFSRMPYRGNDGCYDDKVS